MDFEQYAQSLRQQYDTFTNRLAMEFAAYQKMGGAATNAMRVSGLLAVDSFVTTASNTTRDYLRGLGTGVDTGALVGYLTQVHAIAAGNLNEMITRLSAPAGPTIASVLTRPSGVMGQLAAKAQAEAQLGAKDSAGRNWKADKLIALLSRDFAYQAYVDATVSKIEAAGYDMVQLTYPDKSHRNQGLVLRLTEIPDVRKTLFHPNATARLEAYVQG